MLPPHSLGYLPKSEWQTLGLVPRIGFVYGFGIATWPKAGCCDEIYALQLTY